MYRKRFPGVQQKRGSILLTVITEQKRIGKLNLHFGKTKKEGFVNEQLTGKGKFVLVRN